jgi:hypothetical protein
MTDEQKQIKEIDAKILKAENFIKKFKNNVPFAVFGGLSFSFVAPFIPGKPGRKPMIETLGYTNAVLFMLVIYFSIYLISYFYLIRKSKKEIESLKRAKISIENKVSMKN